MNFVKRKSEDNFITNKHSWELGSWCLTAFLIISQLYSSGQCYWLRIPEFPKKPLTCPKSLTNCIPYCYISSLQLAWPLFQLAATFVMNGTDCIRSSKFNYHTIKITEAPKYAQVVTTFKKNLVDLCTKWWPFVRIIREITVTLMNTCICKAE